MRKVTIGYRDAEAFFINTHKEKLKQILQTICQCSFLELKTLDHLTPQQCQLVILNADHVPEQSFQAWLDSIAKKFHSDERIWIPALIFAELSPSTQAELITKMAASNWYFDIIHPDHLNSLPPRVANLLRIHDHIQEILAYDQQLKQLLSRVQELEADMKSRQHGTSS